MWHCSWVEPGIVQGFTSIGCEQIAFFLEHNHLQKMNSMHEGGFVVKARMQLVYFWYKLRFQNKDMINVWWEGLLKVSPVYGFIDLLAFLCLLYVLHTDQHLKSCSYIPQTLKVYRARCRTNLTKTAPSLQLLQYHEARLAILHYRIV